jgi:hypothetical protein
MRILISYRSAASLLFIIGLSLMFLGTVFLFGSMKDVSKISVLTSFFFVLTGIACAVFAIKLNKRSLYLFFATFFLQLGLFLFLSALHILPVKFSQAWPVLSVFSGIALIPTGWHRYGIFRLQYLVPAGAFIVLGVFLLIFSLDLVPFSLFQFVLTWWPLLLVLAGLTLILVALGTKKTGEVRQ